MDKTTWTVAFRKPRANRFRRVTDWSGTWHEAVEMTGKVIDANPDLEVWYTTTHDSDGVSDPRDRDAILTDTGRYVRVVDDAKLSDVLTISTER